MGGPKGCKLSHPQTTHIHRHPRTTSRQADLGRRLLQALHLLCLLGLPLAPRLGALEVLGDGERMNLSVKSDSGEFNLETDSFGLAILSPFLGSSVPLADIYITANVKGIMEKGAEDLFSVSGNVSST